ncbi:MAG: immunoglobulin domain-containing protein [Verrucomicrobiia bacterium]
MNQKIAQLFRLPALLLAAALQIMPIARAALPAAQASADVLAIVFRWAAGMAAALGGVQAVSGASTVITSPLSTNIVQGTPFVMRLITAPNQAGFWSAANLPSGISLVGTNGKSFWELSGTPTVTGTYKVPLTAKSSANAGPSETTSNTLTMNISPSLNGSPPGITTQPANQSVTQGQNAVFSVVATGTAPLAYYWYFGTTLLNGQTNSSLTIIGAQSANAGSYSVVVSNSLGTATSASATLTVNALPTAPAIVTSPGSLSLNVNQSATFTVVATGATPLSYLWFKGATLLINSPSATYTIPSVQTTDAGTYSVIVSNSLGTATSAGATLTVNAVLTPPAITAQPANQFVYQGQNAQFSVAATGSAPLVYHWRRNGINLVESTHLAGTQSSLLAIVNATTSDAGRYSVVITNNSGSITSQVATLTVTNPATAVMTVQIIGKGSTGPNYNGAVLQTGKTYSMTAAPASGFVFSGWTGGQTTNAATITFVMKYGLTLTANFTDVQAPTVSITKPSNGQNVTAAALACQGSATDNGAVQSVWYQLNGGAWLAAAGTNNWTANVSLVPGPNQLRVFAVDTSGNHSTTNLASVTYVVNTPIVVQIIGSGTVSPNYNGQSLQIGKSYTMTAQPGAGYVLSKWNGGIYSTTPALTFVMVSNLVLQANFVPTPFNPVAGTYNGLFYDTNGVVQIGSGFVNFTLAASGAFTGSVHIGASTWSMSGLFDVSGDATTTVNRGIMSALAVQLHADLTGNSDQITGTVSPGDNSFAVAGLAANRNVFNAATNPCPKAGTYTLVIPGTPGATQIPAGDGYGTVTVNTAGLVTVNGILADGTSFSQSTTLSKSGQWALYEPLYPYSRGSILGWLTFSNSTAGDINGWLSWIRPVQPTMTAFTYGFAVVTAPIGSLYTPPPAGQPVLNLANGNVALTDGALAQSFTNQIQLNNNNTIINSSDNGLQLTINPANGTFSGNAQDPTTDKWIPFKGIVLQKQNTGGGFFLNQNESGGVFWGP